jgi:hypothetical protein
VNPLFDQDLVGFELVDILELGRFQSKWVSGLINRILPGRTCDDLLLKVTGNPAATLNSTPFIVAILSATRITGL